MNDAILFNKACSEQQAKASHKERLSIVLKAVPMPYAENILYWSFYEGWHAKKHKVLVREGSKLKPITI